MNEFFSSSSLLYTRQLLLGAARALVSKFINIYKRVRTQAKTRYWSLESVLLRSHHRLKAMMKQLLNQHCIRLSRAALTKVKSWALRRRVWFSSLSRGERAQMNLTIRIVKRIHNSLLARVLRSILKKLFEAAESEVSRLMRDVGEPLAEKLSSIAKGWGCKSANGWAKDEGFIRFLTLDYMNTPERHTA